MEWRRCGAAALLLATLLVAGVASSTAAGTNATTTAFGLRTRPVGRYKPPDDGLLLADAGGGKGAGDSDMDDKKSLAQQVAEGKYGLIQDLLPKKVKRPGIVSYASNPEVPSDTADNLGGLDGEDIWLAEDHVLVLAGGGFRDKGEGLPHGQWPPIDDYEAPRRQVKIPAQPSVPPPFPVQLRDGERLRFVGGPPHLRPHEPPPHHLPPVLPPSNNQSEPDEDDPSLYYPPPYDFRYEERDNTTQIPPGPLVPGIVLPPPPDFFSPLEEDDAPPRPNTTTTTTSTPGPKYLPPATTPKAAAKRPPPPPRKESATTKPEEPPRKGGRNNVRVRYPGRTDTPLYYYDGPGISQQVVVTSTTSEQQRIEELRERLRPSGFRKGQLPPKSHVIYIFADDDFRGNLVSTTAAPPRDVPTPPRVEDFHSGQHPARPRAYGWRQAVARPAPAQQQGYPRGSVTLRPAQQQEYRGDSVKIRPAQQQEYPRGSVKLSPALQQEYNRDSVTIRPTQQQEYDHRIVAIRPTQQKEYQRGGVTFRPTLQQYHRGGITSAAPPHRAVKVELPPAVSYEQSFSPVIPRPETTTEPPGYGYDSSTRAPEPLGYGYVSSTRAPEPLGYGYDSSTRAPKTLGYGYASSTRAPEPLSYGYASSTRAPEPLSYGYASSTRAPEPLGYGYASSTRAPEPLAYGYGSTTPETAQFVDFPHHQHQDPSSFRERGPGFVVVTPPPESHDRRRPSTSSAVQYQEYFEAKGQHAGTHLGGFGGGYDGPQYLLPTTAEPFVVRAHGDSGRRAPEEHEYQRDGGRPAVDATQHAFVRGTRRPSPQELDSSGRAQSGSQRQYPTASYAQFSTTTASPLPAYYTTHDVNLFDDNTKNYFTVFGQKLGEGQVPSTTPLPFGEAPFSPLSLADDIRVNFREPLPPINPDSEYVVPSKQGAVVSYQLPGVDGKGSPGASHYYFLTPVASSDARVPQRETYYSQQQGSRPSSLGGAYWTG